MPGVFLSYRRKDSGRWVDRLQERLELQFGDDLVLRDVDDLRIGRGFLAQIRRGIRGADAVLVVIGPDWLSPVDGSDRPRLFQRNDVLRREIEWSLASRRTSVVPILVGGAPMPAKSALPASIRRLPALQARSLADRSWDADCSALLEGLRGILRRRRTPEPLEGLHAKLVQREQRYFDLLPTDPARAGELASATLRLLDRQAPFYPQDAFLQICRGYAHKNLGMAIRDDRRGAAQTRSQAVAAEIQRADATFAAIGNEATQRLAEAANGLGSVAIVRNDLRGALAWIDKALALVPDYPAALSDRAQVMAALRPSSRLRR